MTETLRTFRDGEIIFREGDDSLAMFVVRKGKVRLLKTGPNGTVTLARLGKGEMFGEMGIVDGIPRSASAVAQGAVTVEVTPRHNFLDKLQRDPELALQVMTKLVERLRAADEQLALRLPGEPSLPEPVYDIDDSPVDADEDKPGLFGRLFNFSRSGSKNEGKSSVNKSASGPLRIGIAAFGVDMPPEGLETLDALSQALGGLPNVILKRLDAAVTWPKDVIDPETARQSAQREALSMLAARGVDVLVWGRVETIGHLLEVHATAAPVPHELRLGRMSPAAAVFVPLESLSDSMPSLVRAQVLAAVLAEGTRRVPEWYTALQADVSVVGGELPRLVAGYAAAEQAATYLVWANAAALCLGADGVTPDMWQQVVRAYENAGRRLPRQARDDWADVYTGLALVEHMRSERGLVEAAPGGTVWDGVIDTLKLALESVRKENRPWEWALLQERLGAAYYRQAAASGDDGQYKAALNAYQQATQIYTRADHPLKWAELVSALAQVLQVYGDMLGSAPALERAVELLQATLDVRPENSMPLLWAASQNNLGSALFLLAKRKESTDMYRQSADAFRKALTVYQVNGQGRQAAITEKNLARAEAACSTRSRRDERLAQPGWSQNSP